jgi:hypothetical protein
MVSLEFYLGRKRLSIEQYCAVNGLNSFAALCENLQASGVTLPQESTVSHVFLKPEPVVEPLVVPAPTVELPSKTAKRKEDVQ